MFKLPVTRALLMKDLGSLQLFQLLWTTQNAGLTINAPSTLPIDIKSRDKIKAEVAAQYPNKKGLGLSVKQNFTFGKTVINFYKVGLKNVWTSYMEVRKIKQKKYHLPHQISSSGKEIDIKIPSFHKLVEEMSQALFIDKMELEAKSKASEGLVKKDKPAPQIFSKSLFNLTREEFQTIKRSKPDAVKVPFFALIVAVFFEFTPAVCYLFPEVMPSTCVLPTLLNRVWGWQIKSTKQLDDKIRSLEDPTSVAMLSAYRMPLAETRLLADAIGITLKYVPTSWYPELYLRRRIQQYKNYLSIDNYYLSGLNGGGNVWDLSKQELLRAALERNLIKDIGSEGKAVLDSSEDETALLRLKLIEFIVNFNSKDVGYLANASQIEVSDETRELVHSR